MSNEPTTPSANNVTFSQQKLQLIRETLVPPEITPDQFDLFINICKHLNLDPFKRQIFALPFRGKRNDEQSRLIVHTSIEGYRAISARSGRYEGIAFEKILVTDKDGTDQILTPPEFNPARHKLVSATVGLHVTGYRSPVYATALWDSYCPTYDGKPSGLWLKHPLLMLLKCAEALAHRKAALADFSGVYVTEELHAAMAEEAPDAKQTARKTTKKTTTPDSLTECWNTVAAYLEATAPEGKADEALVAAMNFLEKTFGDIGTAEDTPENRQKFMNTCRGPLLNYLAEEGLTKKGAPR